MYIEKEHSTLRVGWPKICETLESIHERDLAEQIKSQGRLIVYIETFYIHAVIGQIYPGFDLPTKHLSVHTGNRKESHKGRTALMAASEKGYYEIVSYLLQHNSPVNQQDEKGLSSLILACLGGHEKVVQILMENDADINLPMKDGTTCLMIASNAGHTKIVKLLVMKGAKMDTQNDRGATALMCACKHGHLGPVKVLMKNNADATIQDVNQEIALNFAIEEGHRDIGNYMTKEKYVKCCCCYLPA